MFKRSHLVSTAPDSQTQLFSLPPSQFVYFSSPETDSGFALDINRFLLQQFERDPSEAFADAPLNYTMPPSSLKDTSGGATLADLRRRISHQAQSLVSEQSKLMQKSSLPTLGAWLQCSSKLLKHLIPTTQTALDGTLSRAPSVEGGGIPAADRVLNSNVNSLWRFSQKRCMMALPVAKECYTSNLPSYYTEQTHQKHLEQALTAFGRLACGPAMHRVAEDLRQWCLQVLH